MRHGIATAFASSTYRARAVLVADGRVERWVVGAWASHKSETLAGSNRNRGESRKPRRR